MCMYEGGAERLQGVGADKLHEVGADRLGGGGRKGCMWLELSGFIYMSRTDNVLWCYPSGPLPLSLADFLRLIWEQRLPTVVMVTQCIETGKVSQWSVQGFGSRDCTGWYCTNWSAEASWSPPSEKV